VRSRYGAPGAHALWGVAEELERLRARVPEAIIEGEAEEVLLQVHAILRAHARPQLVARPYSGPAEQARLLAQLAAALRARMEMAGTPYVHGVNYFAEKLEDLAATARILAAHYGGSIKGPGASW